jgi:peptidoglycan/LPS O-acetylase OafA/YrhL
MKINEINSKSIDSLRVICCLIVLISHIYELKTGVLNNPFNEWISFAAVGIFFFLSGYVNYISFKNKNDVLYFWKKRVERIYPAFTVAVSFSIILAICFDVFMYEDITAYFFTSHWLFNTIETNPALWSLSYEAFLYFVFPAFLIVKNRLFWRFLALCCILIVFNNFSAFIMLLCFIFGVIWAKYNKGFFKLDFYSKYGKWTYEVYVFHYPALYLLFESYRRFIA